MLATSTISAAPGVVWDTTSNMTQTSNMAQQDGSFSSQVTAAWNGTTATPPATTASASSANLSNPSLFSAPADPPDATAGTVPGQKNTQADTPASGTQIMQPALVQEAQDTPAADAADSTGDPQALDDAAGPQPVAAQPIARPVVEPHGKTGRVTSGDKAAVAGDTRTGTPSVDPAPSLALPADAVPPQRTTDAGPAADGSQQDLSGTMATGEQDGAGQASSGATGHRVHGDTTPASSPDQHEAHVPGRDTLDPSPSPGTERSAEATPAADNRFAADVTAALGAGGAGASPPTDIGAPVMANPSAMMPASSMQADADGAPAQVGASLLTLASSTDGSNQLALSLHPKDLGSVRIQLDRSADGTVRVLVAASEPGTLRSLMTDQAHLHAALDAAAVPGGNRHLSFELTPAPASPDAAGAESRQQDSAAAWSDSRSSMDMSGGNRGGQSGQARSGPPGAQDTGDRTAGATSAASGFLSVKTFQLRQGSINITA